MAKQVTDPNVLAISGVQMTGDSGLCIVSPWVENGNLITYLRDNDIDRDELVGLQLYGFLISDLSGCSCSVWSRVFITCTPTR